MSYSRWSNSVFYTFWSSTYSDTEFKFPTKKLKDNQVFTICDIPSYDITYKIINESVSIEAVSHDVMCFYDQPHKQKLLKDFNTGEYEEVELPPKEYTIDEQRELEGYMMEFRSDVDSSFELKTFFKENWWYPTRNFFYWKIKDLIKWITNK